MLVGKSLGPFTIDKEIGAGAMGSVYRAKHNDSGKWVAIKVVAPAHAANEVVMQRFEREWEILKQLKHPNIVRLLASGRYAGAPFYAMEYVEGESLDTVMARRGRISWEEVVRLGQQLCSALQHAHDKGIVHRDLKPSNVMVLKDGTVKLTDFGIAKDLDRTAITEVNCTVGTASYMSPEQCRGERNLTYKSDLYSMGVMFYELITGKKPFEAESPLEMFMQHVHGKFERPSRLALEVPVFLDTLICQLMEKDPERRPYSAEIVSQALGRVEEKVSAQQAAGLDAARTRNRDLPPDTARIEATDKEAVRALLGKKKKRRAGETQAFYQKTWFKAVGLCVALMAIVAALFAIFLVKPSAESLYANAESVMKSDNLDKKATARKEGPIYLYLRYYGNREDEQTQQIRTWADLVDAEDCQRLLLQRIRLNINTNVDDDELNCRKAIESEEAGNLLAARDIWTKMAMYKDEPQKPEPSEKRSHGLLAQSRLQALDEVDKREKKLEEGLKAKAFKPADDNEKDARKALQLEKEKSPESLKAWEALYNKLERERDDPSVRPWYLLAAKRLRELKETSKKK